MHSAENVLIVKKTVEIYYKILIFSKKKYIISTTEKKESANLILKKENKPMKKTLLVLMILALAVALVACGGNKEPEITEDAAATTTTAAPVATTTALPSKYTVKFVEPELFGGAVISETQVARNKAARAPLNPSHEGYIFLGWDEEDYSSITSDLTITALYRPVDTYTVTFYNIDGTQLGEPVTVKEGEAVAAPEAPKTVGKIFAGWDKQVGKVDRNWSDFEAYKDLSAEEIAAKPLEYKVTATYEDADGVVAYKEGISMEFKEVTDANGKKNYEPVDPIFSETTAKYLSKDLKIHRGTSATESVNNSATFSVAWDGEFVYVYAKVYDPTVLTRGEAYCNAEVNPWQNDSIEIYYCFFAEPSASTRQVVKLDAYGYRMYSDDGSNGQKHPEMSKWFADITVSHKQAPDADTYHIIFKIPAKAEDGVVAQAADTVSFSEQINDLRSLDDLNNMFCSGGNRPDYSNWFQFSLAGKN